MRDLSCSDDADLHAPVCCVCAQDGAGGRTATLSWKQMAERLGAFEQLRGGTARMHDVAPHIAPHAGHTSAGGVEVAFADIAACELSSLTIDCRGA